MRRPKAYMTARQVTEFLREHGFSEFDFYTNSNPIAIGLTLSAGETFDIDDFVPSTLTENGWKLKLVSTRLGRDLTGYPTKLLYVEYLANKQLHAQLRWEVSH